MRKIFCLGVLGSITCTAIFYLMAGYAGRHPDSLLARHCLIRGMVRAVVSLKALKAEAETACIPDEPQPVDLDPPLPDSAKLTAHLEPIETIDVLKPPDTLDLRKLEEVHKNSSPEELVPAAAICSADEAECFRLMPYCEGPERLSTMPHPDETVESARADGSEEEQEDQGTLPLVDQKAVEQRLQRILHSYLQEGQTGVDTLEFRPSDAKKGEFDRIPF